MDRFRRWIAGASIGAILVFIIATIVAGIIGNNAYALFLWLWDKVFFPLWKLVISSITANSWPLVVILILLLASCSVAIFLWWNTNRALKRLVEMVAFDEVALYYLASVVSIPTKDREEKMKDILRKLLLNAASSKASKEHVDRAVIFLPDETGEYLKVWATHGLSPVTIERAQFYIGEQKNVMRGVAGETFKDGKLRVGHMIKKDGKWICEEYPSYIDFETRPYPPYKSFVCVPITALAPNSSSAITCLGVICFDSKHPTVFDSAGTRELLNVLGKRVGAALSIYRQLSSGSSSLWGKLAKIHQAASSKIRSRRLWRFQ